MSEFFIESFNSYKNNFSTLPINTTTTFDNSNFEIRFIKVNKTDIIINSIFVSVEYQKKGILSKFLEYICKNDKINFKIVDVMSNILYNYLLKFRFNNKKFKLKEDGFTLI